MKLTRLNALAVAAGLALASNVAMAHNLCYFASDLLKNNGFTNEATYSGDAIHKLLQAINVTPDKPDTFVDSKLYRVVFRCTGTNDIATASLNGTSVTSATIDGTVQTTTDTAQVKWTFTS